MHVAVLGAGVVGVTTAYYLCRAGHTVTVVERENTVANGCSHANGSQLSYSYTDVMSTPTFLARIPRVVAGRDPGIRLRPPLSVDFLRWGSALLMQCTSSKADGNMLATLQLALRSKELLTELKPQLDSDFAHRNAGKLVLLPGEKERQDALHNSSLKSQNGCSSSVISLDEAIAIEPAVQHMRGDYCAAVYSPGDDVGDAHAFTQSLSRFLQAGRQCVFQLATKVHSIIVDKNCARGIATSHGLLDCNAVVVCLGASSPAMLKPLGIRQSVYPVRGYSVTLNAGSQPNSVSVTDLGGRFVVSRIDDRIRIAGFADITGFDTSKDSQRIADLYSVTRRRAPHIADHANDSIQGWGGFRPLTPNGRPLVGATPVQRLFQNTGHGTLGWTLACASGELLADAVSSAAITRDEADPLGAARSACT